MISNRAKIVPPSPIRKLVPYADEAKRRGIKVYHLNIGQPDIPTPKPFWEAVQNYKEEVLAYGPSDGLLALRETVAEYYQKFSVSVSKDNVFITTGGSEAILFTYMVLGDIGDEFLIPEPSYANYISLAAIAQVKLKPIPTNIREGFHLPGTKEIEKLITPETRGIIICTPNNPTGTVYTRDEMERIVEIVRRYNIFVISDEVYREFLFDNKKHTSILSIPGTAEHAIIIDSISKRFSACGARIGFIVTKNKTLLKSFIPYGMARLCSPTVEQVGAIQGFKKMQEFIPQMIREYEKRRNIIYEELQKIPGVVAKLPEGAFYIVCSLPVADAEDFARWMLTDFNIDGKTTMVAPVSGFYVTPEKGKNEVRIAYVLKEKELRDAIQILKEGIKTYNEKHLKVQNA
ncbi:pyridoxal phosphate-dependent aminotransferase [candidate division WOR-3 bacterium]|nr:pyridoxal phosphate-dependent aminotransferase [candidate division WOR-3 bacterium]